MQSRSPLRRLAVAAGAVALTAGLAGCTDPASAVEPTGGLALVVGARSNMPAPSVDGPAADALNDAIDHQSQLSMVIADGQPFELDAWSLTVSDKNAQAAEEDRVAHRQRINRGLTGAAARTPEVDLLAALDLGARSISSAGGEHTIVVVDSGLSTAGPLDFTEPGLLDADPTELAASLEAADELPDLAGVEVVFQGLGDTAAPQEPIGRPQRTQLSAIWAAVIEAAGGSSVLVDDPLSGPATEGVPPVTPVTWDAGVECTSNSVTLSGGDVAFQPDRAVFLDEAAATAVVEPIADQVVAGGLTATVTGTTADVGDTRGQQELSLARAQAVADVLTGLGVPAASLTVLGLGSEFPGYVQDHDASGNLIPAAAAANRKVVIDLAGASAGVTCTVG